MSKKPVSAKQHICGLDPSPSSQTASNSVLTIQGVVTFLLKNKNAIIKLFFFLAKIFTLRMLQISICTCKELNYLSGFGG